MMRSRAWIRHIVNIVLWYIPPTRLFSTRRVLLRLAGVELSDTTKICGRGWIYGRGHLKIGDGTWISPGCQFFTHTAATIEIGSGCDIGPDCSFVTGSHDIGPPGRRAGRGVASSIFVGGGAWLGARSLLLAGSTVGAGAVVAAGSVVVGDLPPNHLAAGVPAKPKRELPG